MVRSFREFLATPVLLLALTLWHCAGPSNELATQPLVDDQHLPDVLTESRVIDLPPSYSGNRFVRGWFPWQHEGTPVLVPNADGAVIEVVNISAHSKSLLVNVRRLGEPGEFEVVVEVANEKSGMVPLAPTVEIPLPQDLPQGRIPVVLTLPKQPDPVVLKASLSAALPPGEVSIEPTRIVQGPSSLVDFTRPVDAGTLLTGEFEPPSETSSGQRFAILVEQETEPPQTAFEWTGSWLDRIRGRRSFSVSLGSEAGLKRIRLVAEGSGPSATWHRLGLASAVRVTEVTTRQPPPPPRIVVLYVFDALRADHVDLAGDPGSTTPTLGRLAAEGVVFSHHSSVAPNTLPSTKSLFTGQAFLLEGDSKLSDDIETLAEVLATAGYRTAAFSGNGYVADAFGLDQGFQHLADHVVFQEYTDKPGAYNDNAERVHRAAIEWLDNLREEDRAFLYLHTIHPHNPYDPPEPFHGRYAEGIDSSFSATTENLLHVKHGRTEVSEADQERIRALYNGGLAYNDLQLAALIEELERRFSTEEILLIVTSDHGEELFDHDGVLHGYTLYKEQLDIPLIFWWPGTLEPRRVELATDNLDLHETLRSLVRADPSLHADGRPLWGVARGQVTPTPTPEVRFAAASSVEGGIFLAQSERYKLIFAPREVRKFGMGEGRGRSRDPEYLFDLTLDPEEMVNRAGEISLETAWLRSRLSAWIERGKYLEMDEEEPELDEETQARLRALGYLD